MTSDPEIEDSTGYWYGDEIELLSEWTYWLIEDLTLKTDEIPSKKLRDEAERHKAKAKRILAEMRKNPDDFMMLTPIATGAGLSPREVVETIDATVRSRTTSG